MEILPSRVRPPFLPGSLPDQALQAHRVMIYRRWATLWSAGSGMVLVTVLIVLAAIFLRSAAYVIVVGGTVLVAVCTYLLISARAEWRRFPFRYTQLGRRDNEQRTPGGALALLTIWPLFAACFVGFRLHRLWAGLAAGLFMVVLLLPATVPFLLGPLARGRIADRELARHPEQVRAIAELASRPGAPQFLPAWLAAWSPEGPAAARGFAPRR